jgi:CBS domain-containing protein
METEVLTVAPDTRLIDLYGSLPEGSGERSQRLYPVVNEERRLIGAVPWSRVLSAKEEPNRPVSDVMLTNPITAFKDEILRSVADRMVHQGIGVIVVVSRDDTSRIEGLVNQFDLLTAREKLLVEERHVERVLRLRRVVARRGASEPVVMRDEWQGPGGDAGD